jgi:hypothetical protein
VVRALATQTEVDGRSGEEYRDAFLGRFEAVLRADDLLLTSLPELHLDRVIRQAVARLERIRIDAGPPMELKPAQVGRSP